MQRRAQAVLDHALRREVGQCGVHVFDRGAYRRLPASEVAQRIVVSDRRVQLVPVEVLA